MATNMLDFSDFLETQPQALYQSFLSDPKTRMSSSMKRYYQNQFSNIQSEYLGKLARDMRQKTELPTQRFGDYLQQNVFQSPSDYRYQRTAMPSVGNEYTGYGPSGRETMPMTAAQIGIPTTTSPLGQFTGYDRFRRESPYARSAYGAGPMSRSTFAPSARWITY